MPRGERNARTVLRKRAPGAAQAAVALAVIVGVALGVGIFVWVRPAGHANVVGPQPFSPFRNGPGLEQLTADSMAETRPSIVAGNEDTIAILGTRSGIGRGSNPAYRFDVKAGVLSHAKAPPFSPAAAGSRGVSTGTMVVTVGALCENRSDPADDQARSACYPGDLAVAGYDLQSGDWQTLPVPKDLGFHPGDDGETGVAIGWTGREAVFTLGYPGAVMAFDPAEMTWRRIGLPTGPPIGPSLCADRGGLVVSWQTPLSYGPEPMRNLLPVGITVAIMPPGSTDWQVLKTPSLPVRDPVQEHVANDFRITCGPNGFLLSNGPMDGLWRYETSTGHWSELPKAPFEPVMTTPSGHPEQVHFNYCSWDGSEYLFWGAVVPTRSSLAYSPTRDTWREVVAGPEVSPNEGEQTFIRGKLYLLYSTSGRRSLASWTPLDSDGTLPQPIPPSPGVGPVPSVLFPLRLASGPPRRWRGRQAVG